MAIMKVLGGILGGVLTLWIGWGVYVIYTTERPPHEVTQRLGSGVEVRQYAEQTWISTAYTSDRGAFPVLGSYIFGRNQEQETVAMTAPVITGEKMTFILPAGVTQENAPTPDGQPIEFTTVPPRKVAALAFSWWVPEDRVARKTAALLEVLREAGVETVGEPFLMRYNDPWTPPFLRRNEVGIEVR
ncbi:MAG: heme-binding protein [Bacteroidota bacterium]